jgi:hypothetical protein
MKVIKDCTTWGITSVPQITSALSSTAEHRPRVPPVRQLRASPLRFATGRHPSACAAMWHDNIGQNGMGEWCDVGDFGGAGEGVQRMGVVWGAAGGVNNVNFPPFWIWGSRWDDLYIVNKQTPD